ncbi:MAG: flagellar hook-associated protein FlgK, partial [Chthoniobacteraceae bacterium]
MAGLLGDLVTASRALAAQQAGVQVAGRNISNVNTPGYARQRVILGDRAVIQTADGPRGTGVEALGVKQIRDGFLDLQVVRESSQTEYLTSQQGAYQRAESALGEQIDRSGDSAFIGDATGSTNGLATALNDFFNGFDNVASNPTENASKQVLLQKAQTLVSKFNLVDQRLSSLQNDLTSQIGSDTTTADNLLQQIADLNKQIQTSEINAPGAAMDLRDQRQTRLEELSKYLNFTTTTIPGGNGQIQITAKDTSGSDVLLVDRGVAVGTLAFNGAGFTGGASGATLALTGGSLQGNLSARDGAIQQLRDDVKTTATQFATAVNAAYNPTSTTGDFFTVPPASGIIQLDSTLSASTLKTTDTGNVGANELSLAVSEVAQKKFSTTGGDLVDGTISGFYNKLVSGFGETIVGVDSKLADQKLIQGMITQQRDSVSGVSMDEEVADLMKFQRAYQASSRVIGVIDSMLE